MTAALPAITLASSAEAAAELAAAEIAAALRQGLASRGEALALLPGGSSPAPVFQRLATGFPDLDWPRIRLMPGDERQVAEDHADSNLRLIRQHLGRSGAQILPLSVSLLEDEAIDCAMLGMGLDGHVASLFPGDPGSEAGLEPGAPAVLATLPGPGMQPAVPRLTVSARVLARAGLLLLFVPGAGKRQVLAEALAETPPRLPVARVLRMARGRPVLVSTG